MAVETAQNLAVILQQMQASLAQQALQHSELMAQLIDQRTAPAVPRLPERPELRSALVPKFVQVPHFNGKAEQWEEFQFRLKRAVRSQSAVVESEMKRVEGSETIIDDEQDWDHIVGGDGVNASMETSACLFDVLAQHVEGEALVIIKSAPDYHGFEAWRRLHRKYSPRTMARRLRLLMAVVNPGRIKSIGDIQASLNLWEERILQLETQFKEKAITDELKVAIVTSALPAKVQDYIFSQPDKDPSYLAVREMILNFVARVADSGGPSAMDVGNVDNWNQYGPQQEENQWEWSEPQMDPWVAVTAEEKISAFDAWAAGGFEDGDGINALQDHSRSVCYSCNQTGHISPNCPQKAKGKGKNNKGKGKGGKGFQGKGFGQYQPKGSWNQKGSWGGQKGKGKGKGKGYEGTCWNCNQVGHKAFECQQQRVQNIQGLYQPPGFNMQPTMPGQPLAQQTMGPIAQPEPVHLPVGGGVRRDLRQTDLPV